jgi:quinol monooxygenase YgiN
MNTSNNHTPNNAVPAGALPASPADVQVGLMVRIEAKPGHEADVEAHLRSALAAVREEPATTAWLAIRLGPNSFAIVDAFPDEDGRAVHLQAGKARLADPAAMELFAAAPAITYTEIIAAKLPTPEQPRAATAHPDLDRTAATALATEVS